MSSKKKVVFIIVLALIIISTTIVGAFATSKGELEKEEQKKQEQIDSKKREIEQIDKEYSETMKEIQNLTAQISEYQSQIDQLDGELSELERLISETQIKLDEAQAKYLKQEEMLQKRLVALYEAGETTYLDVLLSSSSVADFISNYYLVSEITTYDTELLDQMEKNKNEIQEAKNTLESSKTQVETVKNNKVQTTNSLKNSQNVKQQYASQLNEQEKQEQELLEQFEKDKRDIERQLAEIAKQQQGNNTEYIPGNPGASGYIFPVAGCNIYNINKRVYPSYPGHTGVDVNINVKGKKVVAVKSGTVVTAKALKNSNGTYRSYGEYVVINHHDGTMTLYAHGLEDSIKVNVGQYVEQGQVLMTVGNTGNSTGTHLHFEVRVNGRCVNPLPYLQ